MGQKLLEENIAAQVFFLSFVYPYTRYVMHMSPEKVNTKGNLKTSCVGAFNKMKLSELYSDCNVN